MTPEIRRETAGAVPESAYVERGAVLTALLALAVGCVVVLRPFIPALLLAVILVISTWPLYRRLDKLVHGRRSLSASLMTIAVALLLLLPIVALGVHLGENAAEISDTIRSAVASGLPAPPGWIGRIPIVGAKLQAAWFALQHDSEAFAAVLQPYIGPAREWLIARGGTLLQGIIQLSISLFVVFFLFRDGPATADTLSGFLARLSGHRADRLLSVAAGTINGVVRGVLGTALVQAVLMAIGFRLAGIPAALSLGFVAFFVSLFPLGMIVLWLPAAIWLMYQDSIGWAVFMSVWGLFVGTIESWLRPLFIVKQSGLPLALTLLGILGGMLSFGFLGIFIGPVLLAVGGSLVREWASARPSRVGESGS